MNVNKTEAQSVEHITAPPPSHRWPVSIHQTASTLFQGSQRLESVTQASLSVFVDSEAEGEEEWKTLEDVERKKEKKRGALAGKIKYVHGSFSRRINTQTHHHDGGQASRAQGQK